MAHTSKLALIVIVLAAASAQMLAQTDEIQVYDAEIAEPGIFNVMFHTNYTPVGRTKPEFPNAIVADRSVNGAAEWAYGVTPWFEQGLYLPVYSFSFSSTRAAVSHEAEKFDKRHTPGSDHGCFSREGADREYDGHYSKQVLDCISQLAPPLRLATMSFLAARTGLRTKTAESIAQLAGGEFFHFGNAKELKADLIVLSNHLPNYYVLSFRPTAPTPGLHALHVDTQSNQPLVINSRREYWIEDDTAH